ncbi:DUF2570 domain-containing protein [Yersinia frederiksenii]|uniref:DUF2570 domain-containing protein n=1 Tax=Yersinia frederiksenii TaxID=29484 RepID=UPI001643AAF8|nr:DUF2570 domain-containing protein [Yersinia frederiksenii]
MNRVTAALIAALIAIFTGLAWAAFHYHGKYTAAEESLSSTQAVAKNALTAINLMYDISKATHEAKQQLAEEGEASVVYIREAVKGDACANQLVPAAATDNLRMLENSVRAGKPAEAKP